MERKEWTVDAAGAGLRLDKYLHTRMPEWSRTVLQRSIRDGLCQLWRDEALFEGLRASEAVLEGDRVTLDFLPPADAQLRGEDIDLEVLYEDDYMLVINKAAGMVVHPGAGNFHGTVVNALLGRDEDLYQEMDDGEGRPGIVHRLDKETSGVLVIAKTAQALERISRGFARRQVSKYYIALVRGIVREGRGTIRTYIARSRAFRKKMEVTGDEERGKEAITHFKVIADNQGLSLLKLKIDTGRTHQIRVHMAHIGHPVVGDKIYGMKKLEAQSSPDRHLLHAWRLTLKHPFNGNVMTFTAPLPEDFRKVADNYGLGIADSSEPVQIQPPPEQD